MTFEEAIDRILVREGSTFTDDVQDHPTKFGITIETFAEWRHFLAPMASQSRSDLIDILRHIGIEEARSFYRWYLMPFVDLQMLGPREWDALIDAVVNHGRTGAIRLLQAAIGVDVDGKLGPRTMTMLSLTKPDVLLYRLALGRVSLMVADVRRDIVTRYGADALTKTDLQYLRGWLFRVITVAWGPSA